ncbi:hypothetical protein [Actinoplanes sp. NPDC051851]|uniref:hypothetical protein n=1 Tax=Actinoplanes sp. NPDC051851 TaxID=3154753 RepID=UPI00344AE4E2
MFAGRWAESKRFRAALDEEPGSRPVHFLHGPPGSGKSALLRAYAATARAAGRTVVMLDGHTLDPGAFRAAAARVLDEPAGVLLVDAFDRCQGLEGWLWERFLPTLPVGAVAVIAGRTAPDPRWTTEPGWDGLAQVTVLGPLPPAEAAAYLDAHRVPPEQAELVLALSGGHPLTLALATALALRGLFVTPAGEPHPDAVRMLSRQLIGHVPSDRHRAALEVCAHARVTTEPLLRAVVGDDAPALFGWLREQPYLETTGAGLVPHEAVRETLEVDLRSRSPQGYAALHGRLRDHLFARLRTAPPAEHFGAVGDLLYLFRRDPFFAHATDWQVTGRVTEMSYRPAHVADVLRLAATTGDEDPGVVAFWLDRQPEAFRVYADTRTGEVTGFGAWLRLTDGEGLEKGDPAAAAAWEHVRATDPLHPGEHIGIARFSVADRVHRQPSAALTLIRWRSFAEIARAERLAWSCAVHRDDGRWDTHLANADLTPVAERPRIGRHRYAIFGHDWRTRTPASWLRARSETMLSGRPRPGRSGPAATGRASISRREFDAALRDALQGMQQRQSLAGNPLLRTRLAVADGRDLGDILRTAAEALRQDRGGENRYRAVVATYLKGAPTQKAAAERLGLPFGTYRRHLAAGVEALSDHLWRSEVRSSASTR